MSLGFEKVETRVKSYNPLWVPLSPRLTLTEKSFIMATRLRAHGQTPLTRLYLPLLHGQGLAPVPRYRKRLLPGCDRFRADRHHGHGRANLRDILLELNISNGKLQVRKKNYSKALTFFFVFFPFGVERRSK